MVLCVATCAGAIYEDVKHFVFTDCKADLVEFMPDMRSRGWQLVEEANTYTLSGLETHAWIVCSLGRQLDPRIHFEEHCI